MSIYYGCLCITFRINIVIIVRQHVNYLSANDLDLAMYASMYSFSISS